MPGSTNGSGTCAMPSAPPISITPTKAAGQTHSARPPLSAAHRPTATITVMWSRPDERMRDAGGERGGRADADMGEGRACAEHEQSGDGQNAFSSV